MIDRDAYFAQIRAYPFGGELTQGQVDGMNDLLDAWEANPRSTDLRWLAYGLATAYHETGAEMQPIEEYGRGEGMAYGEPDPVTGNVFYGRGYTQLTWADNYQKADQELGYAGDESCYWHPEKQLTAVVAADTMFQGLAEGWFRSSGGTPNNMAKYFNEVTDDPYLARESVNGDKHIVPSWSNGVSIGNLIAGYHDAFLEALWAAWRDEEPDHLPPEPDPAGSYSKTIVVTSSAPIHVSVLQVELKDDAKTGRPRT